MRSITRSLLPWLQGFSPPLQLPPTTRTAFMKPITRSPLPWLQRLRRTLARLLVPVALGLASATALAGAPNDRLTLLVPDGADLNTWQVKVWTDSAAEEGIRLEVIRDSALLAMGSTAASKIGGLVVPDSAHLQASDALIAAVKQYASLGGKLMLVYDAGALTDAGFYPLSGNSRFAELAGVEYVFWNGGLGAATMVGFGQVVGTRARLDSLAFPPGKYLPYVPPASLASTTTTTAFVPTSRLDPGGTQMMTDMMTKRAAKAIEDGSSSVRRLRGRSLRDLLGIGVEASGPLRFDRRNLKATKARDMHGSDRAERSIGDVAATLSADLSSSVERTPLAYAPDDATLQAISGYAFGPLGYFHFVTTGTFPGTVYLSSPEHGLVAGMRSYGSGQVLFVNMPLGYFKAIGTDSAPLHGFLNLFARDQVGIATLSVQPRGVGGIIYNWHVDDGDDLTVDMKMLLDKTDVLKHGPFSIHFTAGPDVVTVGDGNGMNLNNSKTAQDLVRRLDSLVMYSKGKKGDKGDKGDKGRAFRHELGSHGGWIHDYWGLTANEANVPDLTSLLTWNFDAIESVGSRKIREYSSPEGNTPSWAVKWLEQRGVVATYLLGDVGNGMVRSWRAGERLADKVWTSPVSPLGKYATFEEFDLFGVTDATSGQWLLDLQSFVVNHRTNRQFYNHPPGVAAHLNPVNALLTRADRLEKEDRFSWYTMSQLADFSQRRVETTWSSSTKSGTTTFSATHPTSLEDVTWLLPKSRYTSPLVVGGLGDVSSDSKVWIVTAGQGMSLQFTTTER